MDSGKYVYISHFSENVNPRGTVCYWSDINVHTICNIVSKCTVTFFIQSHTVTSKGQYVHELVAWQGQFQFWLSIRLCWQIYSNSAWHHLISLTSFQLLQGGNLISAVPRCGAWLKQIPVGTADKCELLWFVMYIKIYLSRTMSHFGVSCGP